MSNRLHNRTIKLCAVAVAVLLSGTTCNKDNPSEPDPVTINPICEKQASPRTDAYTPESVVSDWGQPIRLGEPINTPCPQDAIEISRDGQYLYILYTEDLLDGMTPEEILSRPNNTYRAKRLDGPASFELPVYYDLAKNVAGSLDGELSFTPDGTKVYFHSNRANNLGYVTGTNSGDYLDIYVAGIVDGVPGPGVNVGIPVNSIFPDGEHAIHPDGVSLYFTSLRLEEHRNADIFVSRLENNHWTEPIRLDTPINSAANDLQPEFTADGDTMYFVSDRNPFIGTAIYRTARTGDTWGPIQLVIKGIVGEPSITADGQYLYFVHVLSDASGTFDSDVWYCPRTP